MSATRNDMKYVFHYQCAVETAPCEFEAEDIILEVGYLPFFPAKGIDVCLTPNMDFALIDGVMWNVNEPDVLHVDLEEPRVLTEYNVMIKDGWRKG